MMAGDNEKCGDQEMTVLLLLLIFCACMRGCWHVGRIADKVSPETDDFAAEPKRDGEQNALPVLPIPNNPFTYN